MSRTRPARTANSRDSSSGRPKSFTSVAPGAENRSVIWVPMAALCSAASRRRSASREPIRRAGIRKIGNRIIASTVTCQDVPSITIMVRTRATTLLTTPDRVPAKADCAPMTSLLRRLTRAPVRVRVKNAMGIFWTWSKTLVRRSTITPSPIVEDIQRLTRPSPASATATTAISTASRITSSAPPLATMVFTTWPARTGVATARNASAIDSPTNAISFVRYGRAKPRTRFRVAFEKGFEPLLARVMLYREPQATRSMLIAVAPLRLPSVQLPFRCPHSTVHPAARSPAASGRG